MNEYFFKNAQGRIETVKADRIVSSDGRLHLVHRGEILRSFPAGTVIGTTEVTEEVNPARAA
jgi:hypothetical protein